MSHYSEIMKKKSWLQKLKKMLMHIPNYKLNRIIGRTALLMSFLLHIRLKHMLKKTEFPVFHHLTMKNDTVFQFFQQKQKTGTFSSKSSNCNNSVVYTPKGFK